VEAHIHSKAQAKETELVEIRISFAIPPYLFKLRSSREPQFELQRDSVNDFQLKESARYKMMEVESVADFGHRPRKPGGGKAHQLPKGND
jgi:hypothetical protein